MDMKFDGSETSKIVRDEDTEKKRRKNVKQSMVLEPLSLKVILMTLVLNVNIVELFMHVILNVVLQVPLQKKREQTQMTLASKPKDKVGEALAEMIIVD